MVNSKYGGCGRGGQNRNTKIKRCSFDGAPYKYFLKWGMAKLQYGCSATAVASFCPH